MGRNPNAGGFNPLGIPATLKDVSALWRSIDWEGIRHSVQAEAEGQVVIVGPVNSGKSTLFNLLQGDEMSEVSPIAGTTRRNVGNQLGPFTLIDTPGFGEMGDRDRANTALAAVRGASVVVLLIDAGAGLRHGDVNLYNSLRRSGVPIIVVLNKTDLLDQRSGFLNRNHDKSGVGRAMAAISQQLGTQIIPVSARTGTNVAEQLIPAIIEAQPTMAVAIGRELPHFRQMAAQKVIRQAMGISAAIGAEPIPFLDIPFLIARQITMVSRLAAIYGEPPDSKQARALIGAILGGLGMRQVAQQAAKYAAKETVAKVIPLAGNMVAAGFAAAGTWAIGQAVAQYYESGKRMSVDQLRQAYDRLMTQRPFTLERQGTELPPAGEAYPDPIDYSYDRIEPDQDRRQLR